MRNFFPSRKKRAFIPSPSKTTPEKSPRTVASVASVIARSWCEPVHAFVAFSWHFSHALRPTNAASAGAALFVAGLRNESRTSASGHEATTRAAATTAASLHRARPSVTASGPRHLRRLERRPADGGRHVDLDDS